MKTIFLSGELGRIFGRKHRFAVKSAAEAIRALSANFPNFQRTLIESSERGVGYQIFVGRESLERLDALHLPAGKDSIRIVPVISGAGSGPVKFFVGAALVAASVLTGGAAAPGTFAYFTANAAFAVGVSLTLGGVAQMLTKPPQFGAPNEPPESDPSYHFDGPVNTTAQGQPIPVGYGKMIVGSAVVSAGVSVEQLGSDGVWVYEGFTK